MPEPETSWLVGLYSSYDMGFAVTPSALVCDAAFGSTGSATAYEAVSCFLAPDVNGADA